MGVADYTWIGEDTTGFWIQSILRSDPSVATLAGLRTWLLAQTPSGAGVDITLAQPGGNPAAALELAAANVTSGGPFTADFFSV